MALVPIITSTLNHSSVTSVESTQHRPMLFRFLVRQPSSSTIFWGRPFWSWWRFSVNSLMCVWSRYKLAKWRWTNARRSYIRSFYQDCMVSTQVISSGQSFCIFIAPTTNTRQTNEDTVNLFIDWFDLGWNRLTRQQKTLIASTLLSLANQFYQHIERPTNDKSLSPSRRRKKR